MTIDVEGLRGWIGRTESARDVVTPRLVAELAATLDRDDASPDAGNLDEGAPAPLAVHWCLAPPALPMRALGRDGHPARGGFLPPVPLPRRMWAGGRLEFTDRLRVGDAVERRSRIEDVTAKQGRGGPLCFVAVVHEYRTERGLAVRERQDIVYREDGSLSRQDGASAPPAAPPVDATAWAVTERVETSPTLLFRYSAVTFNGHRIHYDIDYCRDVEGYPGLVVHGPLQATWLVDLAARVIGRPPAVFSFRGVQPPFAGAPLTLAARPADEGLALAVLNEAGHPTMLAEAR